MFTHHPGSSAHVSVGFWRLGNMMMLKRNYLALAACVTQLLSSLPSSGKTWEPPWAWREAVWWWWYGSMKTTRSCTTRLKQRSRPCPHPSSVDLWTVSLSRRQIACICDLGMLSYLSEIWDVCSCFWTSFFQLQLCGSGFFWPHPPALDLRSI